MINASVVVAHPDDCLLFAYHFVAEHPFNWRIIYLTYTADSPRGQEVAAFWKRRKYHCEFLGYADNAKDSRTGTASFNSAEVQARLEALVAKDDLIVTHHRNGEYGHPHHKFVSLIADEINVPKIYFGQFTKEANLSYSVEQALFDLEEIPLHAEAVQYFGSRHNLLKKARYIVSPEAQAVIEGANQQPYELVQEIPAPPPGISIVLATPE